MSGPTGNPPTPDVLPGGDEALEEVARLWPAIARDEEGRFNQLNGRALGVLQGASLVTAIAGFLAKDVVRELDGVARDVVAVGLGLSIACLAAAAGFVVIGVLLPRRFAVFGDNDLVTRAGRLSTAQEVQRIVVSEFAGCALYTQRRNVQKARCLNWAYLLYFGAVVAISVAAVAVAVRAATA
jgi:hypothetical protein